MAQAGTGRVAHRRGPRNAHQQGREEALTTLHPALRDLFDDLELAGLRWSLLRVPSNPSAPTGDVDLLVSRADAARLRGVLEAHGFVAVPGWRRFPTMLYVGFHEETARCLLLDITDEVTFADGLLRTDSANRLLDRSSWHDGMRTLSPDDAFWALLLHCLLDKGKVPEHYRPTLLAGAAAAGPESELARFVGSDAGRLLAAAAAGDWDVLERSAADVAAAWLARQPPRDRRRHATARLMRLLRAPLLLRRRYGVSVALLGPNGAGKSTLARGLVETWPFPVTQVYMGLWKSGGSAGSEIPVVAQLLRPLTAWVRYLTAVVAQLRGHLVVFDRYVHDARRPPEPPLVALKRGYLWLLAHCIPAPDLLVLLDLPGRVSYGRKDENSVEEGDQERADFLALARELPAIHVVDATQPVDRVRASTLGLVWDRTRVRWGA